MTKRVEFAESMDVMDRAGRMLADTAHDLRGPIGAVASLVEMTLQLDQGQLNLTQRENLDLISQRCQEMSSLVGNMLEYDRIRSGLPRTVRSVVDVNPLRLAVESVIARDATARGVSLAWRGLDQSAPQIWADPDQLRRWTVNLVTNAIRITQPGGRVTVYLTPGNALNVRLGVRDTGSGFNKDQNLRLQQTGRASSDGLGISICRQIAALHHSWLWLNSEPGVGTSFEMFLPIASPAAVATALARWRSGSPAMANQADGFFSLPDDHAAAKTGQITVQSLSISNLDSRSAEQADRILQSDLGMHEVAFRGQENRWSLAWDEPAETLPQRRRRLLNDLLPLLHRTGLDATALRWSEPRWMDAAAGARSPIVETFVRESLDAVNCDSGEIPSNQIAEARDDLPEASGFDQIRLHQRLSHELRQITAHFRARQAAMQIKSSVGSGAVPVPRGNRSRGGPEAILFTADEYELTTIDEHEVTR